MTDAKEMWEAIKSRFGGNDESKKMQKYILKQQFEGFSVSNSEGLHKGYDSSESSESTKNHVGRTKPGMDSLSFDDLYNNLRVFENDVKGSTTSSSSIQNYEHTSSYSLLANQSSCPQLDHEDLEQLDEFDLEEMDLKWQVAMISMRMKKFYKKTGRKLQFDAKEPVGFDKDKKEDSKALVTINGEGVDWTSHSEEEEDYALMACNSSGSNTKVTSCSKECKESYAKLKKLYDAQREQLSDESIEIKAYTQGLKKVKAQLVIHQQGQLWYEEKIRFIKIDLDDKTDVLTYHKKLLAEAQKEKDDLKAKVEKWHNSSKNLGKLLNSQMSANDKFGLGYGDHRYDGILSYENEVFSKGILLGNYMPSGPDIEIDYSQFTYGPKQSQLSESETQTSEFDTCESNISVETSKLVSEPVINEPNIVCLPKVWSDAPITKEYESDTDDYSVLTRTSKIPVNTARASGTNNVSTARDNFNRQTVPTNANTVKPIVNNAKVNTVKPMGSTFGKPLNRTTTLKTNFSYQKVNTIKVNAVSAVGEKRETAVKPSASCNWRPKGHYLHKVFKYNGGSSSRNYTTFKDLLG
ncbi:hypothetical protein Tco_0812599, partial [Tanacetum coccineum]